MIAQIDSNYIKFRFWKLYTRFFSYLLMEGRPLTTKGRWINHIVFLLLKIACLLPALRKVNKPVFILGTGRSGTTILGIVLSMHKQVAFLNEPKAVWNSVCSFEDLIGSYTREPAKYRLGSANATERMKKAIHKIYGWYLTATFSQRVVDKYPEMIFRVPFIKQLFPDAQLIFLMRNGWDTCRSIEGWSGRLAEEKNGELHDWWGVNRRKWNLLVGQIIPGHADLAPYQQEISAFTSHTDMAAVEWIVTMREGLKLAADKDNKIISLRYEELCQQPQVKLASLATELELKHDQVFLDYAAKTLHPVESQGRFELHPLIVKPFEETMRELGYA